MTEQKFIDYEKKEHFSVLVHSYSFTYEREFVSFTAPHERQESYYLTVIGQEYVSTQDGRQYWLHFHNDTPSVVSGYGSISESKISETKMEINFHIDDKFFCEILNSLRNEQDIKINFSAGKEIDSTTNDYMIYTLEIESRANKT